MDINRVIEHFGNQSKLAKALGIERASVSEWKRKGEIPVGRQYQIEVLSRRAFKADRRVNAA